MRSPTELSVADSQFRDFGFDTATSTANRGEPEYPEDLQNFNTFSGTERHE